MSHLVFTAAIASLPVEQIVAALNAELPTVAAAMRAAGAQGERDRIQAVRAQLMAGHEQLIETLAFDGKTTGPEAAVAVVNAERAALDARKKNLAKDTPPAVPSDASATGDPPQPPKGKPAGDPQAAALELATKAAKVQREALEGGRSISAVEAMAIVIQKQQQPDA